MRIAMLGGSFNPIHRGHLMLADCVCADLGYDRVLFVPTFKPPHKEMCGAASSHDRLEMVRAAIRGDGRFVADPCELERGGVSYTWDTVCHLEAQYAGVLTGKLGVVFGEDLLADYDKWEHAAELAERVDLILARRPKNPADECVAAERFKNAPTAKYGVNPMEGVDRVNFPFPHKTVENPPFPVSSTEIRRKIAENGAWRYLVSSGVFHYIKENGLYDCGTV